MDHIVDKLTRTKDRVLEVINVIDKNHPETIPKCTKIVLSLLLDYIQSQLSGDVYSDCKNTIEQLEDHITTLINIMNSTMFISEASSGSEDEGEIRDWEKIEKTVKEATKQLEENTIITSQLQKQLDNSSSEIENIVKITKETLMKGAL